MAVFGYRNAMVDVVRRWARESGTTNSQLLLGWIWFDES